MSLKVENGTFRYRRASPVLEDVGFTLPRGELLAVLGPNGIGKTTLLRCMLGLLPWTHGRTLLDGVDIKTVSARRRGQLFAFVPQARNAASLTLTGRDMLLIGRSAHLGLFSQPSAEDGRLADKLMERIGISHLAEVSCSEMSGGQLQMVLIARALVAEPAVLVLDEPETGLDFRNQLIVLDLLESLGREGMTIVMNTHYPSHALRVAHRALLLSRDGAPRTGSIRTVLTPEALEQAFGVEVEIVSTVRGGRTHESVMPIAVGTGPCREQSGY